MQITGKIKSKRVNEPFVKKDGSTVTSAWYRVIRTSDSLRMDVRSTDLSHEIGDEVTFADVEKCENAGGRTYYADVSGE